MALRREIEEELGIDSRAGRFLGAVEHSFIQKGKRHCEINVLFSLEIPDIDTGSAPASAENHIEFRWAPLESILEQRLEPVVLCDLLRGWTSEESSTDLWASGGDFEDEVRAG